MATSVGIAGVLVCYFSAISLPFLCYFSAVSLSFLCLSFAVSLLIIWSYRKQIATKEQTDSKAVT